jgi:hypothetical protein
LSVLWAIPLLGFVVTEYYALKALRGEAVPSWLPPLSEVAISGAMLILVFVPAVDFFFVRAQAELLARVLAVNPVLGLKWRRLRRGVERENRRAKKLIAERRKMFDDLADKLNERNGLLVAAEKAGVKDLGDLRTEMDTLAARQREGREELERLVAQRATYRESYLRRQSELQGFERALSKLQREATAEHLLPGPNSNARLARISADLSQISEALASDAGSANEPEHPAESNDG